MPEGGYCYDGTIAPLHDFLGVFAYRKQAATIFGALSYDELCPDRRGRIAAFLNLVPATPPPAEKKDVEEFLDHGRETLTRHTIVLASHLLAAAARDFLLSGAYFRVSELHARYEAYYARYQELHAKHPWLVHDPGLDQVRYRSERFRRFERYGLSRYFRAASRGRYRISTESVARFARSERTVNDIEWNYNHVRHIFEKQKPEDVAR